MSTEAAAKKDIQKLQRAIVDGLEDVKAQELVVFNTEHLSSLFERVIIASGTSNRQTRALAASVRDAVREAGFPKPRIEGEENGEWIIVDCAQAVVHVMQPAIRTYYNLEEIWGDKPVRIKLGAPKPAAPAPKVEEAPAKKGAAKKSAAKKTPAKKSSKRPEPVYAPERPVLASKGSKPAAKTAAKPAAKAPTKSAPKSAPKTVSKVVVNAAKPARKAAKPAVKAPAARRPAPKKPT